MPLKANALTTLALAKSYLKIPSAETSQDALVEHFINAASDHLETETNRALKLRSSLIEYQDGQPSDVLTLREWPIVSVAEIRLDAESKFGTADTILDPSEYAITDDGTGIVKLLGGTWWGSTRSIKVTYSAGYNPVPSDLENACLWLVFWYTKIRDAADIGRSTKNKEGESISYLQGAPDDVKACIARYKRTEFPVGMRQSYNELNILS